MREIKFRAWDKNKKEMIPAIHIFVNGVGVIWENKRKGMEGADNLVSTKNFVLMQYTGLKDKNGVHIYEGDIFKHYDVEIRVMEWKEGYSTPFNMQYYETSEDFEVIGNIYEHPHLLNPQTPTT